MNARAERRAIDRSTTRTDLPFYDGAPAAIGAAGWTMVVAAALAGFAVLSLAPSNVFVGALSLVPAIVFTALPLAALSLVSGGHASALFRRYGARAFGISVLVSLVTMACTVAVALVARTFAPMQPNAFGDVLATIGALDFAIFLVRTFVQLIGEEVVTVVVLLAVMWLCHARLGLGRRSSVWAGVVVSTLWFASLHLPTYGWNFVQCFAVIGTARLVLTWSYLRTGNLWVSTGAHIINDWSIFAVTLVGTHMPIGA